MLSTFFNDFFQPISLTFLGLLLGAAMIGLGIGYWIWGTLAKRLALGYDRISNELAHVNLGAKNAEESPELERLRRYSRQVEEERNRLLVDNNLYQKQDEKMAELSQERNQLWQELLDVKEQLYSYKTVDGIDWQAENQDLRKQLYRLKEQNKSLQNDLDTQLDYLKNQLLQEVDAHDEIASNFRQIQIDFAAVVQERTDWKMRYEAECTRNSSQVEDMAEMPSADISLAEKKQTESQYNHTNYSNTSRSRTESPQNEVWEANDANLADLRKTEVRQLLEDRWLTTSPDDGDKLQRISGIGPVLEQKLNDIGIYSFEQLSRLDDFLVQKVAEALGCLPQRIIHDNWVGQAKVLLNKD